MRNPFKRRQAAAVQHDATPTGAVTTTEGATHMNNTRNVVTASLRSHGLGHYANQAEPVIADLEEWIEKAIDYIVLRALDAGISTYQINEVLDSTRLTVSEPEPEPEPEPEATSGGSDLEAKVEAMATQIAALVAAAERAGVRV